MAVMIKCKMCGGDLVLTEGSTVATCEYCGSTQTVPSQDNEKKLTLFARANRLRAACEFDKAAGIYESIVADFPEEAESYWGLVLCKYGIEYVDDPATGKKIPTCHRSSFDSIMDDGNFEQAMENADALARKVYRDEAKQIEEIRKGIIEVSSNEEPYDIFICYKETDADGNRTLDSVLAQDIYDALTGKGYRVFFSRITLEDKLGQEYEPYIFAALNSAKVMLAIGTDYEYFNAVWVKNEWSRYLKLMEKDKSKHLIPCFKGIDAYDMPKEFGKLQAQDLGKVGAVQDLLRGIGKIIDTGAVTATQTAGTTTVIVDTMLKRAADAIAVRDWEKAARCYDNVLDYDDKNEQAITGRIFINFQAASLIELENKNQSIAKDPNYQYLINHGSPATAEKMRALEERIIKKIREKKEQEARKKKKKTIRTVKIVLAIVIVTALIVAGNALVQNVLIPGNTYNKADSMVESGQFDEAIEVFASLNDFKDSRHRIYETYMLKADAFAADGNYAAALEVLHSPALQDLGYSVNQDKETEYTYLLAVQACEGGDYLAAISAFSEIPGYQDADQRLTDCQYTLAEQSYQNGDYDTAISQFNALGAYQNGFLRATQIAYEVAQMHYQSGDLDQAISYFSSAGEYEDAMTRVVEITYEAGTQCMSAQEYQRAVGYFQRVSDYSDASDQILKAKYQYCSATKDNPDQTTKDYIRELNNISYSGAAQLYKQIFAWKADVSVSVSLRIGTQTGVSFKANLSGGDGSSTKVKFVVKTNGQTFNYCDDKQYSAGEEASCQLSHSMQDITKWTYTVSVYDENGNKIGSFKGVPNDPF